MDVNYYSREDILKNDGQNGTRTWVIIKNNVYDLTDYLDDHPGGGELITEWAGKDGTKAFDDFGHSNDAKKDLKQYKIGELKEDERTDNKKKKIKDETPKIVESKEKPTRKSCCAIITCGLFGS